MRVYQQCQRPHQREKSQTRLNSSERQRFSRRSLKQHLQILRCCKFASANLDTNSYWKQNRNQNPQSLKPIETYWKFLKLKRETFSLKTTRKYTKKGELRKLSCSNSELSADITSRHVVFSINPPFDYFRNQRFFCPVPMCSQGRWCYWASYLRFLSGTAAHHSHYWRRWA